VKTMVWVNSLKRKISSGDKRKNGMKCNSKIMLYVTAEEKDLLMCRAKDKNQSISYYVRINLKPMFGHIRELYAGKEEEKSN
jgi:hypothetical protein